MNRHVGTFGDEYQGLRIVNIVASGVLGTGEIDTDALESELSVELTGLPGRVYLRPNENLPVSMVFRSGSFTIAGGTSWESVQEGVEWLFKTLNGIGVDVNHEGMLTSLSVKYLVVTGDLDDELNLPAVVVALGMEKSEYEPEQFPAVIYRPENAEFTVLLFSTGKITVTGVQSVHEAFEVFEDIEENLKGEAII